MRLNILHNIQTNLLLAKGNNAPRHKRINKSKSKLRILGKEFYIMFVAEHVRIEKLLDI